MWPSLTFVIEDTLKWKRLPFCYVSCCFVNCWVYESFSKLGDVMPVYAHLDKVHFVLKTNLPMSHWKTRWPVRDNLSLEADSVSSSARKAGWKSTAVWSYTYITVTAFSWSRAASLHSLPSHPHRVTVHLSHFTSRGEAGYRRASRERAVHEEAIFTSVTAVEQFRVGRCSQQWGFACTTYPCSLYL